MSALSLMPKNVKTNKNVFWTKNILLENNNYSRLVVNMERNQYHKQGPKERTWRNVNTSKPKPPQNKIRQQKCEEILLMLQGSK